MRQGNRALLRITRLQTEALMGKPGCPLGNLSILPREALAFA